MQREGELDCQGAREVIFFLSVRWQGCGVTVCPDAEGRLLLERHE